MSNAISKFKRIIVDEPKPEPTVTESEPTLRPGYHLPEVSAKFLFAGKAVFSLTNSNTNEHLVFKVRGRESEWPKGSGKRERVYFLNVKRQGGRYAFRYIGKLNEDGTVKITTHSEYKPDETEYKAGAWAAQAIIGETPIPDNYKIVNVGRCGRCARELVNDSDKRVGFDMECQKIVG